MFEKAIEIDFLVKRSAYGFPIACVLSMELSFVGDDSTQKLYI